ncbi:L,D-transpeptidase family protein [Pedobacter agri]|uniref:L,D-transpeptidase family protein n=1 Tax=Pedobacter agri TaxID=454586 RepID=UPI00397777BD
MIKRSSSYLKRKNIAVYYKNKKIENPSTIRWYKYNRSNFPFLFVQQPSDDNSLGRLKFIFPNSSSVYLHDTNFKQGFKLKNRAISHGCIRVENPLKLAELLVVDTVKYDLVRKELGLKPLKNYAGKPVSSIKGQLPQKDLVPVKFSPKAETPILITYFTAWSQNNKIEYRPDIYKMDEKLWIAMKKFRL